MFKVIFSLFFEADTICVPIHEILCLFRSNTDLQSHLFPYVKVPLDVRCLGMKSNHWNIISPNPSPSPNPNPNTHEVDIQFVHSKNRKRSESWIVGSSALITFQWFNFIPMHLTSKNKSTPYKARPVRTSLEEFEKRKFHSDNALNVFRPHYAGDILKRQNYRKFCMCDWVNLV